jgi:hypothetical protein
MAKSTLKSWQGGTGVSTAQPNVVVAGDISSATTANSPSIYILNDAGADTYPGFYIKSWWGAGTAGGNYLAFETYQGSSGAATKVKTGMSLGEVDFFGGTGGGKYLGAKIEAIVASDFAVGSGPTYMDIWTAGVRRIRINENGSVGIGTTTNAVTSPLQVVTLPTHANNAAALAAGLTAGAFFKVDSGGGEYVVHVVV